MASISSFPNLFRPLQVGSKHVLKNRAIMGSMHVGMEDSPVSLNPFSRPPPLVELAAFYRERAKNNCALIVTGGIGPNLQSSLYPFAAVMTNNSHVEQHQVVTEAVHEEGGKIAMQILHGGRYSYHPLLVAPSSIKAPINPYKPWEMSKSMIKQTVNDYARCAELAAKAGYDGVEIMGSEGYLLNEFLVSATNHRIDEYGGSNLENRMRFPLEIVKAVNEAVGDDIMIIFRISMLDLVPKGASWEDVLTFGKELENAGVHMLNTGIGWHEARIPTIATCVPRAAWSQVTRNFKRDSGVGIPVITSNRINTPEKAEELLETGEVDMVSMARPFLADPAFMRKAELGLSEDINTCIACNQACLDHTFKAVRASCLVNPKSGYEADPILSKSEEMVPETSRLNLAVVGGGPAGLAFANQAAIKGHTVTLYEASDKLGGQFNIAKLIPGKDEFEETLRYFGNQLKKNKVNVLLNYRVNVDELLDAEKKFDKIILATGVTPRDIKLPIMENTVSTKVSTYLDVLTGKVKVGKKVAIIGAGGIGFDTGEFILHQHQHEQISDREAHTSDSQEANFLMSWGVDPKFAEPAGLLSPDNKKQESENKSANKIYLLQRKHGKLGKGLGPTTGWIHRLALRKGGVEMIGGCKYEKVSNDGLHIVVKSKNKKTKEEVTKQVILDVDDVVICAGQEPLRELEKALIEGNKRPYLIGGASEAAELDAKRAINRAVRLACIIHDMDSPQDDWPFNEEVKNPLLHKFMSMLK